MAKLKIIGTITSEEERIMSLQWLGVDGVSYESVSEFIESIPEDDNNIDISIHCPGGSCSEGLAIYDALRATGKEISVLIEGDCYSMATIVLLAAPIERRRGRPNATLLIHEARYPEFSLYEEYTADALKKLTSDLETTNAQMLDIYVDRTGKDRETLEAAMKEERFMSMSEAKALGFISEIETPISAYKRNPVTGNINKFKERKMADKKKEKTALEKVLAAFGVKKIEEIDEARLNAIKKPVGLVLNTADGGELTVEREEGDPQVGDPASPDGSHLMPDGNTIVVADGMITEIISANAEDAERIQELETEVEEKEREIERLENELAAANAKAKTVAELNVLNAVKALGGVEKLKALHSKYKPAGREFESEGSAEGETREQRLLAKMKAKKEAKFNQKK